MLPLSTVFRLNVSDDPTKALEELNNEQFISDKLEKEFGPNRTALFICCTIQLIICNLSVLYALYNSSSIDSRTVGFFLVTLGNIGLTICNLLMIVRAKAKAKFRMTITIPKAD